jgi:hypothetical protein
VIWDLAIAIVSAAAGFLGMLCLMLAWFGDTHARPIIPGVDGLEAPAGGDVATDEEPLVPMPDHLKTREEIVAWMTTEMPKLTAGIKPRV